MATFNYQAIDQTGRHAQGQIDALNEVDLEIRLERMGLDLITFKSTEKSKKVFSQNKVNNRDLVMFCFQLEQLTSAGVPILDGLIDLRESTANPYFQKVLGAIAGEVEGGKMLSQALAEHPDVFDEVFVNLVAAGEQTGQLPTVFDNLASTLKWQDELGSAAKNCTDRAREFRVFFWGRPCSIVSSVVRPSGRRLVLARAAPQNTRAGDLFIHQ